MSSFVRLGVVLGHGRGVDSILSALAVHLPGHVGSGFCLVPSLDARSKAALDLMFCALVGGTMVGWVGEWVGDGVQKVWGGRWVQGMWDVG
jgi:hypothetical protein